MRADYGFDPQRGVWAEVRREPHTLRSFAPIIDDYVEFRFRTRLLGTYDATQDGYDSVQPVAGLLRFLAYAGFFDATDVEAAIDAIARRGLEGIPKKLKWIRQVLEDLSAGLA